VKVLAHPLSTWQNGMRMIPALAHESSQSGGIALTRAQIEQFLDACGFALSETNDSL